MGPDGDLTVDPVSKFDAGLYICLARNTAGERQSSPAQLIILGKFFRRTHKACILCYQTT